MILLSIAFPLNLTSDLLQDNDGKTHFMSATASTQKPDEITTEETVEKTKEGVAKTPKDTPKTDDTAKAEATKPRADKTTPTAPPPSSEPGRGSVAAATGQEEEVKSKHTEKKSEVSGGKKTKVKVLVKGIKFRCFRESIVVLYYSLAAKTLGPTL